MFVYMSLYLHIFAYICLYLRIFAYICQHLLTFAYIWLYFSMCAYIYLYLHIFAYIYLHLPTFTYIYLYTVPCVSWRTADLTHFVGNLKTRHLAHYLAHFWLAKSALFCFLNRGFHVPGALASEKSMTWRTFVGLLGEIGAPADAGNCVLSFPPKKKP